MAGCTLKNEQCEFLKCRNTQSITNEFFASKKFGKEHLADEVKVSGNEQSI